MIHQETLPNGFVRTWGDTGYIINQNGDKFSEAVDNADWWLVYQECGEADMLTLSEEDRAAWVAQARKNNEIEEKVADLEARLAKTDYIALKYAEGIDCSGYGDWKEKRQALRDEINVLQEGLKVIVGVGADEAAV